MIAETLIRYSVELLNSGTRANKYVRHRRRFVTDIENKNHTLNLILWLLSCILSCVCTVNMCISSNQFYDIIWDFLVYGWTFWPLYCYYYHYHRFYFLFYFCVYLTRESLRNSPCCVSVVCLFTSVAAVHCPVPRLTLALQVVSRRQPVAWELWLDRSTQSVEVLIGN